MSDAPHRRSVIAPIAEVKIHNTAIYFSLYEQFAYQGAVGFALDICHRLMELGVGPEQNATCLEIGGGATPHCKWMDMQSVRRYDISDIAVLEDRIDGLRAEYRNTVFGYHNVEEDEELRRLQPIYSRIIASHVFEHVRDPETKLVRWASLLAPGGVLSIALPCDPGWLWRLGQLVAVRKKMRLFGLSFAECELLNAREHINDTQRLLKIIRYYFRKRSIIWFPSLLPIVDINLFCIVRLRQEDFDAHGI